MSGSTLDDQLAVARRASREDRISYRNPIAEFGAQVIEPMRAWLTDPELGAFAVRVLEEIAKRRPEERRAVVVALASVSPGSTTEPVTRDIRNALDHLGPPSARTASGSSAIAPPGGDGPRSPLEERFHEDMLAIYRNAGEATRRRRPDGSYERGYWATYFLRGVRNHGGLPYAKQLLGVEGTTDGFARLTEEGRLDLTMEALILRPEYRPLFNEHEIQTAASRLARAGYQPKDAG